MSVKSVFRGNTEQCLRHYSKILPLDSNLKLARTPMRNFIQTSFDNVSRWVTGKPKPIGESLIRMRYFFESLGYRVEELSRLDKDIYRFGLLLAYNVLSFDDAVTFLGYQRRDGLFDILRGAEGTSKAKREKIRNLVKEKNQLLSESKVAWQSELRNMAADNSKVNKEAVIDTSLANEAKDILLSSLRNLVETTMSLAEVIISDRFTRSERRQLRMMTKNDGIFRLGNLLHGLCSDKSRDIYLKEEEEKNVHSC